MQDPLSEHSLRVALQYVVSSDTPAEHKRVLIAVLTEALRDIETTAAAPSAEQGAAWREADSAQLRDYLQGKYARSWQQADELIMHLATQMQRHPLEIRSRATELGLGHAVDFRLARAHAQSQAS